MMYKESMYSVILLCVLFICQYYNAKASPITKGDAEDLKTLLLNQDFYPDDYLEEVISESDYINKDKCPDCDPWEKRSSKRHTQASFQAHEKVNDLFQSHPKGFYFYQNLLRNLNQPKTSDLFISKGWGAGGMPFNVLYTPNFNQQKILRSAPEKLFVTPVKVYSPIPFALSAPPPPPPIPLNLKQESKKEVGNQEQYSKPETKTLQKNSPRRHYHAIPQLFLSYGWGPIGK